jgi:cytochrome c biogenesis protein CcmG/thiol:disulfide interchange protein DsbE
MSGTMWRYLIPAGLFGALVVFFFVGLGRDKETLPSPLIGKPAPIFELPTVEDPSQMVSNAAFAGKPYVLNIWGSWCIGCRHEHETLMEISRRAEVPIVGLNWKDDRENALRWLSQLGNPYVENAYDGEGRAAIDWGAYGAPETFLIDAQGKVIHKHIAPLTMDIWEREFLPKLRQNGTAE